MPRTFVWHRTRGPKHTPKEEPAGNGKRKLRPTFDGAWCVIVATGKSNRSSCSAVKFGQQPLR